MQKASHARHPRDLLRCIPAELKESIDFQVNFSPAEVAKSKDRKYASLGSSCQGTQKSRRRLAHE